MIQKSVLLGNKEGSWIPCFGLTSLRLHVSAGETTRIKVEIKNRGPAKEITGVRPGFDLPDAQFIRASVVDGPCEDVLCVLLAEEVKRAIQTA
jgi:hypothetical protein